MHNMAMERNQEYQDACNAGSGSDLGSGMSEVRIYLKTVESLTRWKDEN